MEDSVPTFNSASAPKPSPYEGRPHLSASCPRRHSIHFDYAAAGKESFFADRKTQDAVMRNLEIIGEATKCLSIPFKDAHPNISWKPIAGMRDKLVHDYFGVDLRLVWDVVERDLPTLMLKVAQILEERGKES
jgi:uncharacterized protein with HEPN domain